MNFRPLFALLVLSAACSQTPKQPVDYVDPMIGTAFHGHTYPGATAPFGAVQLSPDNHRDVWDACSGYHYDQKEIFGFSHTHLSGTGCADLADVLFHPTTKEVDLGKEGTPYSPLAYKHSNESATPGYYSVYFHKEGIKAEMTATTRTGWHRYTWAKNEPHNLVIDMTHTITPEEIVEVELFQTSPCEVRGMRKTNGWVRDHYTYFVAQFSRPVETIQIKDNRIASLGWGNDGGPVVCKVGISQVSYEEADYNLIVEGGAEVFNFDLVARNARDNWNDFLSRIHIDGTPAQKTIFYTALYHTAVVPNTTSDCSGLYRRNDGSVAHKGMVHATYSTLSLWDTFRAWLPLSSLVYPEVLHDVVFSCLDMYESTGELPIWPLASGETDCMIGYHSIPFIVDAYAKGLLPDMNTEFALKAMVESSNINEDGSEYYTTMGYIPCNRKAQSVSSLLEFAYDDWCIARFAEMTGNAFVAGQYYDRAKSYINVFDGSTGFFRGKNMDGAFIEPFDLFSPSREYTEATPWQYRYFVPQDFKGFACLLGGKDALAEAVDACFNAPEQVKGGFSDITGLIGQYAHGNEPSHHMAFIYNYVGQCWKTQEKTREICRTMYSTRPDGICGNEDCGQMSAWYVMASMGLYEVCPGSGEFALTSPALKSASLRLPSGKVLNITANASGRNIYIQKVQLNGIEVNKSYLTWAELMEGGDLNFILGPKPNRLLWADELSAPYSLTSEEYVSKPYYNCSDDVNIFMAPATLSLGCLTEGADIHYTLDGSAPTAGSPLYTEPFELTKDCTIRAKAFKDGLKDSPELCFKATKAEALIPAQVTPTEHGVHYDYYYGDFSQTADILKFGEYRSSGSIENISLEMADREDFYGVIYTGYIYIPETKVWTLGLRCDDGGMLLIGDKCVVDNDGTHAVSFVTGKVLLQQGYYPYTLRYIESYEDQEVSMKWLVGDQYENIPSENLYIK